MVTARAPEAKRAVCRECGHQIQIVTQDDGSLVKIDPEVRKAIAWPNGKEFIHVRLLHAGVCKPGKKASNRP